MPSDFRCRSCDLRFTVGWLNVGDMDDGYGAICRLVCTACGTEHAIEVALRDRGPMRIIYYDVSLESVFDGRQVDAQAAIQKLFDMTPEDARDAITLLPLEVARLASVQLASELRQAFEGIAHLRIREVDSVPNPLHGPLREDRFLSGMSPRHDDHVAFQEIVPMGPRTGPGGEFDLERQACAGCAHVGSLVHDPLSIGEKCPHCGDLTIEREQKPAS